MRKMTENKLVNTIKLALQGKNFILSEITKVRKVDQYLLVTFNNGQEFSISICEEIGQETDLAN
jgi:hypothetical protein